MAKAKRKPEPAPQEPGDTPTPAQLANGHYERASLPSPDGGNRVAQVHINRGGTPVMRWITASMMSRRQIAVIDWCDRLWNIFSKGPPVTAQYGERMPGSASEELRATAWLAAKAELSDFQSYVPRAAWDTFENVCRWKMPAGVAGGELGYGLNNAETRAHTIVCMVADEIADKKRM